MRSPFNLSVPGRMAGWLVVLGWAAAGVSPIAAGEASAPTVKVVQSGADELLKDLEFLFGLTTSVEQKQYKVIKEFLDVGFLPGIDTTPPGRATPRSMPPPSPSAARTSRTPAKSCWLPSRRKRTTAKRISNSRRKSSDTSSTKPNASSWNPTI